MAIEDLFRAGKPGAPTREEVLGALHDVIDPELGINIVDMGLVYEVLIEGRAVRVKMTMTSAGCPLGSFLVEASKSAIRTSVPGVAAVDVEIVWDPPWNPERMSPDARKALGMAD